MVSPFHHFANLRSTVDLTVQTYKRETRGQQAFTRTDFLFARELGFTGAQLADSAGVVPAEAGCDNYR